MLLYLSLACVFFVFVERGTEYNLCLFSGQHSYKEHGNRMLLIWLHGEELAGTNPLIELHQALVHTGHGRAAGILF